MAKNNGSSTPSGLNRDRVLRGAVELADEIETPPEGLPWQDAMRHRCVSAREVLATHTWAVPLLESRTSPGPATLHHHDAVLACLLGADLPMPVVAHAYAVLDAFVYGFAIQEASLPTDDAGDLDDVTTSISEQLSPEEYPHLLAFSREHVLQPGYAFGDSFDVGLDMVLDGIERLARTLEQVG